VGVPVSSAGAPLRQAVEAERLQLGLPVQADDADLSEGDGVAEPDRHPAVERSVGQRRAAGPRLRRRVPDHGGERGQHIAGGVLPHRAVAAEAAHEDTAAVGAVHQPVREGELLRLRAAHRQGDASLRVEQQAAAGRGDAVQPVKGQRPRMAAAHEPAGLRRIGKACAPAHHARTTCCDGREVRCP
jgi:hypothetical protein